MLVRKWLPNMALQCFSVRSFDANFVELLRTNNLLPLYESLESCISIPEKPYSDKIKTIASLWSNFQDYTQNVSEIATSNFLEMLFQYTVYIVLHSDWYSNKKANETQIKSALQRCITNSLARDRVTELLKLTDSPWGSNLLEKLLCNVTSDKVALSFFYKESSAVTSIRLHLLCCQKNGRRHALRLAHWFLRCYHNSKSRKVLMSRRGGENTKDEVNYVLDIALALSCDEFCFDIINQFRFLSVKQGLELIRRFQKRLHMNDVFFTSPEIYQLASQHFLCEAMTKEGTVSSVIEALGEEWMYAQILFLPPEKIRENIEEKINEAVSSCYIFAFLYSLFPKLQDDEMKIFCFDLYVVMLSKELTYLNHLDVKKDRKLVRKSEIGLAKAFLKLAQLLKDYIGLQRECLLTAFSINPTEECYELIKDIAVTSGACDAASRDLVCDESDEEEEHTNTSRRSVNYGPDSIRDAQEHALSVNSPHLCLTKRSLDDLVSIVLHPRQKELHWDLEWPVLNSKCNEFRKTWRERRRRSRRLKYLNIDFERQVAIDDGGDGDDEADDDDEEEDVASGCEDETDQDLDCESEYEDLESSEVENEDVSEDHEIIDVEDESSTGTIFDSQSQICLEEECCNPTEPNVFECDNKRNRLIADFAQTCCPKVEVNCGEDYVCDADDGVAHQSPQLDVGIQNCKCDFEVKMEMSNGVDSCVVKCEADNLERSVTESDNNCEQTKNLANCYNFSLVRVKRRGEVNEISNGCDNSYSKTLNAVLEDNARHNGNSKAHSELRYHLNSLHHSNVGERVNLNEKGILNTNEDIKPVFLGNCVAYVDIGYDTDDDITEMVEFRNMEREIDKSVCGSVPTHNSTECVQSQDLPRPYSCTSLSNELHILPEQEHLFVRPQSRSTTEQEEICVDRISSTASLFQSLHPQPTQPKVVTDVPHFIYSSDSCFDSNGNFCGYVNNPRDGMSACAPASPTIDFCDSSEFPESPILPDTSKLPNLPDDHSHESVKLNSSCFSTVCIASADKCCSVTPPVTVDVIFPRLSNSMTSHNETSPDAGSSIDVINDSSVTYFFPSCDNLNSSQNLASDSPLDLCIRRTSLNNLQDKVRNVFYSPHTVCSGNSVLSGPEGIDHSTDFEKSCEDKTDHDLDYNSLPTRNSDIPKHVDTLAASCSEVANSKVAAVQSYDLRSRTVPKTRDPPRKRACSKLKLTAITAAGRLIAGKGTILARTRPITRSCTITARSAHSSGLDSVIAEPILKTTCRHQHDMLFTEDCQKFNSGKTRRTERQIDASVLVTVTGIQTRSKSKESKIKSMLEHSNFENNDVGVPSSVIVRGANSSGKKSDARSTSVSKSVAHNSKCATSDRKKCITLKSKSHKHSIKETDKTERRNRKRKSNSAVCLCDGHTGISRANARYRSKSATKELDTNIGSHFEKECSANVPDATTKNLRLITSPKAKKNRDTSHEIISEVKKTPVKSKELASVRCSSVENNFHGNTNAIITRSKSAKSLNTMNASTSVSKNYGGVLYKTRSGRVCSVVTGISGKSDISFGDVANGDGHLAETISGLSSLDMITPPPSESTVNVVQVSGGLSEQERPLSPKITDQNLQCVDESSDLTADTSVSYLSSTNSVTSGEAVQQTTSPSENFLHLSTSHAHSFQEIGAQLKTKSNLQTEIKYLTSTNEVNKILQSALPDTGPSSSTIVGADLEQTITSQELQHDPLHEKHTSPNEESANLNVRSSAEVKTVKVTSPITSAIEGRVKSAGQSDFQHLSLPNEYIVLKQRNVATHVHETNQSSVVSDTTTPAIVELNVCTQACQNNSHASIENVGINVIASLISYTNVNDSLIVSEGFKTCGKSANIQKCAHVDDFLCTVQAHSQVPSIQAEQHNANLLPEQNYGVNSVPAKSSKKPSEEGMLCLSQATLPKFQQAFGKTVYHTNSATTGVGSVSNLGATVVKENVIQNTSTKSTDVMSAQTSTSGVSSTVLSKAVQTSCVADLSEMHVSHVQSAEVLTTSEKKASVVSSSQETVSRKSTQLLRKATNSVTFQSAQCDSRLFTEGHSQQSINIADNNLAMEQKTVIRPQPALLRSSSSELSTVVNSTPTSVTMKSVGIPKVPSSKKTVNCSRFTIQANNLQTATVAINSSTSRTLSRESLNCQEHEVLVIDSSSDDEICYLGARTVSSTGIQSIMLPAVQKTAITQVSLTQPRPLVHISGCHHAKVSSAVLKSVTNPPTPKRTLIPSAGVQIPHISSGPDTLMTPATIDPSTEKLIREFEVVMEEVTNTSQRKERSTVTPQLQTRMHVVSTPENLHAKSHTAVINEVTSAAPSVTPFSHDLFAASSSTFSSQSPSSSSGVSVTYGGSTSQASDVNVTYVPPSRSSSGVTGPPSPVAVTYVATNQAVVATYVGSSPPSPCETVTYANSSMPVRTSVVPGASGKIISNPVVTTYCQSVTSPALSVTSQNSSSPCVTPAPLPSCGKSPKPSKSSKSKSVKSNVCASSKASPVPKLLQKPQEDEQTAQRIYAILDEYAEQLRNSPDLNNKPAPRRRSNPPTNPNHSSKRKKSQAKAKLLSQQSCSSVPEMSPGTEDPRTVGSEDSSSGITQMSHIQDSPAPSALSTDESVNLRDASSVDNSVETESFAIEDQDGHHKLNRLIFADAGSTIPGRTVIVQDGGHGSNDVACTVNSAVVGGKSVVVGSTLPLYVSSGVRQVFLPVSPGLAASVHSRSVMVSKGSKVFRVQAMPSASIQMAPSNGSVQGTALVVRQMPVGTPVSVLSHPAVKQVRLPAGSISSQSLTGITAQPPVVLPAGSHHLTSPINPVSSGTYQDQKQVPAKTTSKDMLDSIAATVNTLDTVHLNSHSAINTVQSVGISTTYHDQLAASVATLITSHSTEPSDKRSCSKVETITKISNENSSNAVNSKSARLVVDSTNVKNSVDSEMTSIKQPSVISGQQVECAGFIQEDQNFHCIGVNFVTPTKVTINDLQSTLKGEYVVVGEGKEYVSPIRKVSCETESGPESFVTDTENEVPLAEVTDASTKVRPVSNGCDTDESAVGMLARSSEFETQEEAHGDNQESTPFRRTNTLNLDLQQADNYNKIDGKLSVYQKDKPDFDGNIVVFKNVSSAEGIMKSGSSQAVRKKPDHLNHIVDSVSANNSAKCMDSELALKENLSSRENMGSIHIQQKGNVLQKSSVSGSMDFNKTNVHSQVDVATNNLRRKKQAVSRENSWRYIPSTLSVAKKAKLSVLNKDDEDPDVIIEHAGVSVHLTDTPLEVEDLTQEHHTYLSDAKLESVSKRHCVDPSLLSSYRRSDVPMKPDKLNDRVELVMQQRIAKVEKELRFQKSLSEECEDLGVDEPSTSDLFPEADLLLDTNSSPSFEQTLQDTECSLGSSEQFKTTDLQALAFTSSSQEGSQSSVGCKTEDISDRSKVVRPTSNNNFGNQMLDWKQPCPNKELNDSFSEKHPKFKTKLRELSRIFSTTPASHSKRDGDMLCQKSNNVLHMPSVNLTAQNFTNCKSNAEHWNKKKSSSTGINGDVRSHLSHDCGKYAVTTSSVTSLKPEEPLSCKRKSLNSLPANKNLNVRAKSLLLAGSYQSSPSSSTSSEDSVTLLDSYSNTVPTPVEVSIPSPVQPSSPVEPSSPVRSTSPVLKPAVRRVVQQSPVRSTSPVLISPFRRTRLLESTHALDNLPSLTAVQKFTYTYGKKFAHQDAIKRARLNRPNQYLNDHGDAQETWDASSSQRTTVAIEEEFEHRDKLDDFSSFRVTLSSDDVPRNSPLLPVFSSDSVADLKSNRVSEFQAELQVKSRITSSSQNEQNMRTKCQVSSKKVTNERSSSNIDNGRLCGAEVLEDSCSKCVDSINISSHLLKPRSVYSLNSQTNMPPRQQTSSPKHQPAKKQDVCANVNNDTIMRFLIAETNIPSVIASEDLICDAPQREETQLSNSTVCSKGACTIQRNSRLERRSSLRGHIKRGCTCCSGSPELPSKKKREAAKGEKSLKKSQAAKHIAKGNISKKR